MSNLMVQKLIHYQALTKLWLQSSEQTAHDVFAFVKPSLGSTDSVQILRRLGQRLPRVSLL